MCADVFDATAGRVAFTIGPFRGTRGIATINTDSSDFKLVVEAGPEENSENHGGTEGPRWTPDGRILFDSNRSGGPDDWHIFVVDANGSNLMQVTSGADGIENGPVMSSDGSMLVYTKYLANPPDGPGPYGGGGIFRSDPDGSNERQVTAVPEGVTPEFPEGAVDDWPDISPDGQQVVFDRVATAEGGLFVVNIDGTGLTRLLDVEFQAVRPRWSPDGQWIVFNSNSERFQTASANVWVIRPDGSDLHQLIFESPPGQAWAADWAPDSQHIVFVHTTKSGSTTLDVIGLDDSPTCILYRGVGDTTGWDPDWGPPAEDVR